MKILRSKYILPVLSGLVIASCSTQKPVKKQTTNNPPKTQVIQPNIEDPQTITVKLPEVPREFRAAWVATVANINWPSKNSLTVEQQKQEAIKILDVLKNSNFNAVIFQARPSADALYKSSLEPWSYFLTGQTGKAPSPFYDPLDFWISEAHKRGMELHVWLNPYRAHHTTGGTVTSESMASKMSGETYRLRNGMYWMDPSDDKVQNHVSAVIKDLVKRYDIDAVHLDDYFYPYKEYNSGKDFPDDRTWNSYLRQGGTLTKADWRRANVNKFIKRIHDEIKSEKSYVKFGISPFGIWKPGYPSDVTGSSQYDELFADAKLWLNQGWCDYFSPQLYWREDGKQRFSSLLRWWQQENYKKIHLWPGLNTVGLKDVADKTQEISNQIKTTRDLLGKNAGEIHYSIDGITKNYAMQSALQNIYREPTLVPASPWIKTEKLEKPNLNIQNSGGSANISWNSAQNENVFHWIVFSKYGENWEYEILTKDQTYKNLALNKNGKKLSAVAIKSVDRLGNESDYTAKKISGF